MEYLFHFGDDMFLILNHDQDIKERSKIIQHSRCKENNNLKWCKEEHNDTDNLMQKTSLVVI